MGRFSVEVTLTNYDDMVAVRRGQLAADQVRQTKVRGVVDTGAARLVLPESVVKQLGLPISGASAVRYADGRREQRSMVEAVHLSYSDRSGLFAAIAEPGRDSALIGAVVLEDLDLIADCVTQTLLPRDPHQIISEIESQG